MLETIRFVRTFMLVGLVLVGCFAGQVAHAKSKVYVGTCKAGTHFSTIQAAVTAAGPGTSINVCPGTYPEQVTISSKSSVSVAGISSGTSGAAIVMVPSGGLVQNGVDNFGNPVAAQILVTNSTSITITNMTVDGTGNNFAPCVPLLLEGIYFQNSSGTISNSTVRNQFQTDFADYGTCQNGLAINVESTTTSAVTIATNSVRAYQKNGITATGAATGPGSTGPVMTIRSNYIVGLGATGMNWLTPGAAENGIQMGFGASGAVSENVVNDNIWAPDTSGDPADAASGIIVYASPGLTISQNDVNTAQFGILTLTDPVYGTADNSNVSSNHLSGTQLFDAIDLCSNSNTVSANVIYGSTESGVHIDDTCTGASSKNSVTKNLVNEACAGILEGVGSGNTISSNTLYNVDYTTLSGDTCTPPLPPGGKAGGLFQKHPALRASPFMPMKR